MVPHGDPYTVVLHDRVVVSFWETTLLFTCIYIILAGVVRGNRRALNLLPAPQTTSISTLVYRAVP